MGRHQNQTGKLKFLFVTRDAFPPYRADVHILFGHEMVERGHTIDWLLQSQKPCDRPYETSWHNCRIWVGATNSGSSGASRIKKHLLGIWNNLKILDLAKRNDYDFIQTRDSMTASLIAILASYLYDTKFVFWLSFPFPEGSIYRSQNGLARYPLYSFLSGVVSKFLLYKIILRKAHHVFVQSEEMKKEIASKNIPEQKMTPVPMGVSLDLINNLPVNNSTCHSDGHKKILYLGALNRIRKIDFLLRVFEQVRRQFPNVKFFIIGGADEAKDEQFLREEAVRLGIEQDVIFTGFLPMEEAFQHITTANVCISFISPNPIFNVGSPTKLVEYMAMSKPVIANDHPEQLTVLSESGGGICVPFEESAFADAIVTLLVNQEKAFQMGKSGRQYVKSHRTYKKIANIVENKYLELFQQSHASHASL